MSYVKNISVKKSKSSDWRKNKPAGGDWYVVRNKDNEAQDFNQKAKGDYIFIYYQIDNSGPGVAAVRFITGANAKAPSGWDKEDVDLNAGAGGKFIYLCYQRNSESNYIKEFQSGYGKTEKSAFDDFGRNAVLLRQDLNQGAKGKFIYLGYYYND